MIYHLPLHQRLLSVFNITLFHIPFFSHPFVSVFSFLFLFSLNMSNAVNTAIATPGSHCNSFMLPFRVMQSVQIEERFPTVPVNLKELILLFCACSSVQPPKPVGLMFGNDRKWKQPLKKFLFWAAEIQCCLRWVFDQFNKFCTHRWWSIYMRKRTYQLQNTSSCVFVTEALSYQSSRHQKCLTWSLCVLHDWSVDRVGLEYEIALLENSTIERLNGDVEKWTRRFLKA